MSMPYRTRPRGSAVAARSTRAMSPPLIAAMFIPLFLIASLLTPATAGAADLVTVLTADDAAADDRFGLVVAIDGDTAVVGAELDQGLEGGRRATGAAYVFVRDNDVWVQQAKLMASDEAAGDRFGYAVDVDGDTIVIGAFHNDDDGIDSGSAYVFRRHEGNWTEDVKLTATDAAAGDQFASAVAISDGTIVIGANADEDITTANPRNPGAAYVFTSGSDGWAEQAVLRTSAPGDFFGRSVDIDGTTIVVGADGDDAAGLDAGALHVYETKEKKQKWKLRATLRAGDPGEGDRFGRTVALDGDVLATGANSDDRLAGNAGSAYVFTRDKKRWVESATITAADGAGSDFFGTSIGISGETIVVGAVLHDGGAPNAGAAYVFGNTAAGWVQQDKLLADTPGAQDEFGRSAAISGTTVVVGAGLRNGAAGDNDGAAYVFGLPGPAVDHTGDADGDGIPDTPPPTDKRDCKKGGWASFNNPTFRHQGDCVRYVNHNQ